MIVNNRVDVHRGGMGGFSGSAEAVVAQALAQRARRVEPGPGVQRLQQHRRLFGALVPQALAHRHAGYDASMAAAPLSVTPPREDAVLRGSRALALASVLGLIVLGLAWELWLAPTGTGTLPGLWRGRLYTYRWLSLLVWLYFTEGVVRAVTDPGLSAMLATLQVLLCLLLFTACVLQVRRHLRLREAAA